MTGPVEPPRGPDGTELTQEEWDAVRRLRSSRVPPAPAPAAPAAPAAPVASPVADAQPPAEQPYTEQPYTEQPQAEPEWVDAEEPAGEPAGEPVPSARRPARRLAPVALPALVALVVVAVTAVVLAALVGLRLSSRQADDRASTEAIAAATSGVQTVLSYNYRSLDADFAKAEALLTPGFRKTYDATTAKAVQPLASKYKAVSTADVSAAGVVTASTSRAQVLVFVSQTVTNSQLAQPRLDRSRIEVDLVHRGGRWLIDKLTPV